MKMQNKRVLVTGAGGFIGSHLVEKLVCLGAKTKAFIRYNSRNDMGLIELLPSDIRNELEIVTGDLRDIETVYNAMGGIDVVFHLGALIAIPYSYLSPRDVITVNTIGTLNVLMAAKDVGVERIIHTSSSEVYGTAQYVPIDEKHPLQAQSPYAASKISADKIAESFYNSYDLPVATIRPFNTYGNRQSARAIIPTIIIQALTQEKIHLGNSYPRRDLTYVTDTVAGFIKIAESPESVGRVINIGNGYDISVSELASKILSIMEKEMEIVFDQERSRPKKSEVDQLLADNTLAKQIIGWQPEVSLEEGLKRTIEWIEKSINLYKPKVYNI